VRVFIVRHAEAKPGEPDDLRPLTDAGRATARALAERLAAEHPAAVLSSPLLRARETAVALDLGPPEADERLAPGATAEAVREAVRERGATVVVVGHQPDCGRIAAALGDGVEPAFPPAGACVVEL
jgi:phosphohistidine phosphatase